MHPITTNTEQRDDSTDTAGASNAAVLNLGDLRAAVDLFVETSGTATLTVEVSATGAFNGEEHEADSLSVDSTTAFEQYEFAYQYVRAYTDANLTELELVSRGL